MSFIAIAGTDVIGDKLEFPNRVQWCAMPIYYDAPLWRPPSEGDSLIIQTTIGCSYNRCSFCSMYVSKQFRPRPFEAIRHDIDTGAYDWPQARRVFLADGDALVLPTEYLHQILEYLKVRLPNLTRVASYATPDNINRKSVDELISLRVHGLLLVYVGIESGYADVLKRTAKGASPVGIAKAIRRADSAGFKTSCMVILGLGGREYSRCHIAATAELINAAPPTYLSTLQLDVRRAEASGFVPRWEKYGSRFYHLTDMECLDEMARLVSAIDPPRPIIFRSNHASNVLPLKGILPKDREVILTAIALACGTES